MPQKLYWRFFSRSNYADLLPRPSFLSQLRFSVFSEQLSSMCLLAKFACLFRDCHFQFQEHLFNSSLVSCLSLPFWSLITTKWIFAFKWRKIQRINIWNKKGGYDPEADQPIQLDFQKRYYGGGTRSVYGEEGKNPK